MQGWDNSRFGLVGSCAMLPLEIVKYRLAEMALLHEEDLTRRNLDLTFCNNCFKLYITGNYENLIYCKPYLWRGLAFS
jgi:hypothetical protein